MDCSLMHFSFSSTATFSLSHISFFSTSEKGRDCMDCSLMHFSFSSTETFSLSHTSFSCSASCLLCSCSLSCWHLSWFLLTHLSFLSCIFPASLCSSSFHRLASSLHCLSTRSGTVTVLCDVTRGWRPDCSFWP